jgi:hypothetical protein
MQEKNQAAAQEARALMDEIEATRQRIGNAYASGNLILGGGGFLVDKVMFMISLL